MSQLDLKLQEAFKSFRGKQIKEIRVSKFFGGGRTSKNQTWIQHNSVTIRQMTVLTNLKILMVHNRKMYVLSLSKHIIFF